MSHPIEQKIAALRRRVRRVLLVHGICWIVAALLPTLVFLGLADYFIHFQDRGIRVICTLALLAVGGFATYRYLWRALAVALRDVSLALRIEKRYPQLADRLSSAVEFLRQSEDDPTAGSTALRRAVIVSTTADLERIDVGDVVDTRPLRRAGAIAGVVCLLAAGLLAADLAYHLPRGRAAAAQIALERLFNPLGDLQWPRAHHLAIKNPATRIALGQPFEAVVVDTFDAQLPDDVEIQYRYTADGRDVTIETAKMQFVDSAYVARRPRVTRPFDYRAVGGDDRTMEWIHLEVVEPPAVTGMSIELEYPAYSALPPATSDKHIRALVGTQVSMRADTSKPLRAATLCLDDGTRINARVNSDGYGFALAGEDRLTIGPSGTYWFELEDREGFHGGEDVKYEIRAVKDMPPSVTLQRPDSNVFVTADARVPLSVLAKDNLAIQRVMLLFSRSDQSELGEQEIELFQGPSTAAPPEDSAADALSGESRLVEHAWNLSPLKLSPGTQINFHATAADYQPAVGISQSRRLTVITLPELHDRIADRQASILAELARVLKLQQDARGQVSGLEIQFAGVGRLQQSDLDQLQGAELAQRQVDRGLLSRTDGVPWQIEGLLAELAANRIDSPDVTRRMRQLLAELDRLGEAHLPVIRSELTAALKSAQTQVVDPGAGSSDEDAARTGRSLQLAGEHQNAVIDALERILGELSEWDSYRRFFREVGQLARDQEELTAQTAELGRQTLTRDLRDLNAQQRADLLKLGRQQSDLAGRLDKILGRMQQAAGPLEENEPLAAATIGDALEVARRAAASGKMRTAGDNIDQNQIGQAAGRQKQIEEDLRDILDVLANRREHELARLVDKLREAEGQLADLRRRQEGLQKKLEATAEIADPTERQRELDRLTREQQQLQKEAERFARQLERLQAQRASDTTGRAAARMSQAGQSSQEGDSGEASQQADAAKRDLDEAGQQLAQRRRQAEADLATEQLAKLEDGLTSLRDRQQGVVEETVRLEEAHASAGQFTRGQAVSARNLARQQQTLQDETRGLAEKLADVEVFHMVLGDAAAQMALAAGRLQRRDTGELTQAAETRAIRRIDQLLEALKPDFEDGPSEDGSGSGGQGGAGGQATDAVRTLAELKMVKLLQEDLNEQTRGLDAARTEGADLTAEQETEYAKLSQLQGRLAEMIMNLTPPTEAGPEDDPESLPEIDVDVEDEPDLLPLD